MLELIKSKRTPRHEEKAMNTTTQTPSKIDLATQELLAARERRDATKAAGMALEKSMHSLEYDTPALWTAEIYAARQSDLLNTKKKLQETKDQLAADNIAVDLADKKLERLQERASRLPRIIADGRAWIKDFRRREMRRAEEALERANYTIKQNQERLAAEEEKLATLQAELLELRGDESAS